MGSVNIEPLAQAMWADQIKPSFDSSQTYPAIWGAAGTRAPLPEYLYMDPGTAAQMASLLGGSLVTGPPSLDYQSASGVIPNGNLIRLPDGTVVLPGNIVGPDGVSWGSLCQIESALLSEVPGAVAGSQCPSASPLYGNAEAVPQAPGAGLVDLGQPTQGTYTPVTTAPVTDPTGGPTSPTSTGTPTVNTTPVQNVGAGPVNAVGMTCTDIANQVKAAQAGGMTNAQILATFAPGLPDSEFAACPSVLALAPSTTDWSALLTQTSIGSIPNWVWLAGVAALFVFGGKR